MNGHERQHCFKFLLIQLIIQITNINLLYLLIFVFSFGFLMSFFTIFILFFFNFFINSFSILLYIFFLFKRSIFLNFRFTNDILGCLILTFILFFLENFRWIWLLTVTVILHQKCFPFETHSFLLLSWTHSFLIYILIIFYPFGHFIFRYLTHHIFLKYFQSCISIMRIDIE